MMEGSANSYVAMTYATVPTSQQKGLISQAVFPHWLEVTVTADNLAIPQKKMFKIFR